MFTSGFLTSNVIEIKDTSRTDQKSFLLLFDFANSPLVRWFPLKFSTYIDVNSCSKHFLNPPAALPSK
jgi:SPX domain protein involved in polyphosphate accumulation